MGLEVGLELHLFFTCVIVGAIKKKIYQKYTNFGKLFGHMYGAIYLGQPYSVAHSVHHHT